VVTAPTGEGADLLGLDIPHATLLQPWGGFIWNCGNFYVHGFSSVVVPTDDRVATVLFNDIGIGYRWFGPNAGPHCTAALVPTLECHVNTPLDESDRVVVTIPDIVDVTAGVYFVFGKGSAIGAAVATPVTGPRPFEVEALVSLNVRY
jgi:hypothetical protein